MGVGDGSPPMPLVFVIRALEDRKGQLQETLKRTEKAYTFCKIFFCICLY